MAEESNTLFDAYPLPEPDAVIDWREECQRLVAMMARGHITCDGKIVAGAYEAYERGYLLLQRGADHEEQAQLMTIDEARIQYGLKGDDDTPK